MIICASSRNGNPSVDIDDRLKAWRDADREAARVEAELRDLGQGAQDPRVAGLHRQAQALRQQADGMLAELVESLKAATEKAISPRSR